MYFLVSFCTAKFTVDGGMHRARVIETMEHAVSVIFIDYREEEIKDIVELFMLPDELLIMPPAVVKVDTDSIVSREQEDKLLGEEVALVLRMEEEKGIRGITNGGED